MFKRINWWKLIIGSVLFFTILCGLSLITGSVLLNYIVIPGLRASKLENLPKAMAMANARYMDQSIGPLPLDVEVNDELIKRSEEIGWSEYQIRAIIAAADATGVEREVLLSVAEMNEGWPSDINADTYKKAVEAGNYLKKHGYTVDNDGRLWSAIFKVIPKETSDNEDTDDECLLNTRYPQNVRRWCEIIDKHTKNVGTDKGIEIDSNLIAAIILQESGGDPLAYSKSGAVGLMQIMPRDGIASGFMCTNGPCFANRPTIKELQDPDFNVKYGVNYLAGLIKLHDSVRDALKHYGPMDVGYYYADLVLSIYGNVPIYEEIGVKIKNWQIAKNAKVETPDIKNYPEIAVQYWTLVNIGFSEDEASRIVDGDPPPIGDDFPIPTDGTFYHPYPGSTTGGYCWLCAVYNNRGNFLIDHPGQDFIRSDDYNKIVGHPIVSMLSGKVVFARNLQTWESLAGYWWISGNVVVVYTELEDEKDPICTFYGHMADGTLEVSVEDDVEGGTILGASGTTGFSTGVHLHLGVKRGGSYPYCEGGYFVNPNPYIPGG